MSIGQAYTTLKKFLWFFCCSLHCTNEELETFLTDILNKNIQEILPHLPHHIYAFFSEEIDTILQHLANQKDEKGIEILFSEISSLSEFIDKGVDIAFKYVAKWYLGELRKEREKQDLMIESTSDLIARLKERQRAILNEVKRYLESAIDDPDASKRILKAVQDYGEISRSIEFYEREMKEGKE